MRPIYLASLLAACLAATCTIAARAGCNLYNAAGIPASPFRTDNWRYPLAGLVE